MLDVKNLSSENKRILNKYACDYGMEFGDFVKLILLECEEKEELKTCREARKPKEKKTKKHTKTNDDELIQRVQHDKKKTFANS